MTGQVRVGVVGLGYFGSFHVRHYAAHPGAALVAVADADGGRAASVAASTGAAAFTDHRDLIGKVDAASVAVPTSLHHGVVADLLEAGIHVLVEKPIAVDTAAARDLVDRARRKRLVLHVGHIERHSAAFAALAGRVSEPDHIECVRVSPWKGRAADVDVVLDVMIHDIDLVLSLAASPVVAVSASGARVVGRSSDVAHARLDFANGVVAQLSASRVAEATQRVLRVAEGDRYHVADLGAGRLSTTRPDDAGSAETETVEIAAGDSLGNEIAAFLDHIGGGMRPAVDGVAGLEALRVAEWVRAQIGTGTGNAGRAMPFQHAVMEN